MLLGVQREDVENTEITEVWPENWKAFQVFRRLGNRWLYGMNGPVSLDMSSYHLFTQRCRVRLQEWDDVFDCILIMENEALRVMAKQQEERAKR